MDADGDGQFTRLNQVMRNIVHAYRYRGYSGSIAVSCTLGIFEESASIRITEDDVVTWWEPAEPGLDGDTLAKRASYGSAARVAFLTDGSKVGSAIATLLDRLQRRAEHWDAEGMGDIEPSFGASTTIGLSLPIIRVGWSTTVALSVHKLALQRWAAHQRLEEQKLAQGGGGEAPLALMPPPAVAPSAAAAPAGDAAAAPAAADGDG